MQRNPVVSGQFYPSDEKALRSMLDSFLCDVPQKEAVALVAPHAGYVYSGAIAGAVFAGAVVPDRVILLGPNHHGFGPPASVFSSGSWMTSLGETYIDHDLAATILKECPEMSADIEAHRYEHSLEVQVPFIQMKNSRARIVPICLSHGSLSTLLHMGESLARAVKSAGGHVLMVASSDMTHYEPADVARKKDMQALERLLALDPEGLYKTVRDGQISMCGIVPTVVMLVAARILGANKGILVRYGHSGEVSGDESQVVGYAGVMLVE